MVNINYRSGRAREHRLVLRLQEKGFLAARTAGSHGIWDIMAVNPKTRQILLIQAKPRSMSNKKKDKIESDASFLNGTFECKFKCVSLFKEIEL